MYARPLKLFCNLVYIWTEDGFAVCFKVDIYSKKVLWYITYVISYICGKYTYMSHFCPSLPVLKSFKRGANICLVISLITSISGIIVLLLNDVICTTCVRQSFHMWVVEGQYFLQILYHIYSGDEYHFSTSVIKRRLTYSNAPLHKELCCFSTQI